MDLLSFLDGLIVLDQDFHLTLRNEAHLDLAIDNLSSGFEDTGEEESCLIVIFDVLLEPGDYHLKHESHEHHADRGLMELHVVQSDCGLNEIGVDEGVACGVDAIGTLEIILIESQT